MSRDYKIFKPRKKDEHCEHWCDCFRDAVWCVEFREGDFSYYEFYCQEHLDKMVREAQDDRA